MRGGLWRGAGLFILAAVAAGEALGSGGRTDARGMGMALTHTTVARGVDAVGTNPANLALSDGGTVTIALLPLGVHLGSDVFSYDLYTRYFSGVETDSGRVGVNLTDADKRGILNRFTDGLGRGYVDLEARPFGLSVSLGEAGTFALTMTERIAGTVTVPKEYFEFLFYGNPPGSTYDFSGGEGSVAWTREYAISYARTLPEIPLFQSWQGGISAKLVQGISFAGVDHFRAMLVTSPVGVLDGTIDVLTRRAGLDLEADDALQNAFPSPAGSGFGLDLGVSGNLDGVVSIGVSLTDLGSVRWKRGLQKTVRSGAVHLENPFEEGEMDSLDRALRGESEAGEPFTTALPATLHLGASVELHRLPWFQDVMSGEMTVAIDYTQGLVRVPGGTVVPRGSLGCEYRPWRVLPLRAGISFGGTDGVNVALGVGLHLGVWDLDLATENLGWLFTPNSAAYGSLALGMHVRI